MLRVIYANSNRETDVAHQTLLRFLAIVAAQFFFMVRPTTFFVIRSLSPVDHALFPFCNKKTGNVFLASSYWTIEYAHRFTVDVNDVHV